MKHSFKFIYLIAIIAVIFIIVTLGLFVMKSSEEFTASADLNITDLNDFNNIWFGYRKKQKGSNVKIMLQSAIKNAEENKNNPEFLLDFAYKLHEADDFTFIYSTKKNNNVNSIKELLNEIDSKHYYTIDLIYSNKKYVSGIVIKYAEKDKIDFVPDET